MPVSVNIIGPLKPFVKMLHSVIGLSIDRKNNIGSKHRY